MVQREARTSLLKRPFCPLWNERQLRSQVKPKLFGLMSAISLAGMLLLATKTFALAAEANFVLLGHAAEVTAPWFACKNKDDVQFLKDASQHSLTAARHYAAARGCIVLHTGDAGIVEDASVWSANTCIRIPGKRHCYWFPDRFIRNKLQ